MELDAVQIRIIGSLIEKQLTTPQQYPLSANALLLACNQLQNREPVVTYSEDQVIEALDRLRDVRLVRFVLPSHGRSAVRYRQVLDEVLGLGPPKLAPLALLLLRGPQTSGELRARSERLSPVAERNELEAILERMADRDDPLVVRLARQPGRKEERWAATWPGAGSIQMPEGQVGVGVPAGGGLEEEVARLGEEVEALREEVRELRESLGG